MNIAAFINESSKRFGTKTAIIDNGQEISYDHLRARIERLSSAFYKIGIREGHRVALILPNSSEFIYCLLALLRMNAIVSPLSPHLTAYELKSIFSNLNPHALICLPISIERLIEQSAPMLADKIVVVHGNFSIPVKVNQLHELTALYNSQNTYAFDTQTNAEAIATINYTYRGTGYPLGAVLSHKNYIEGIEAHVSRKKTSYNHKALSFLSVCQVYPLVDCVLAPLMNGATIVILNNYMPRAILKYIQNFGINHFTAVPSIYLLLLRQFKKEEYDLSTLTCCITGGAYMPAEMQESIYAKMGFRVLQGYGLTECLPVTWNYYEWNKPGTLGLPFNQDFKIRIVDENGMNKDVNQTGEIVVNSPTVMQGYYCRKADTAATLKNRGLYTGDYGYLDRDGYLHFAGLKKRIAKVSGNMVDLKEVENVLLLHPSISDALVYSKNDDLWGSTISAKVVSHASNDNISEKEVRDFCGKLLSGHKIPKVIEFSERLTQG